MLWLLLILISFCLFSEVLVKFFLKLCIEIFDVCLFMCLFDRFGKWVSDFVIEEFGSLLMFFVEMVLIMELLFIFIVWVCIKEFWIFEIWIIFICLLFGVFCVIIELLLRVVVIEIVINVGLNVLVCFMSYILLSVLNKGFIIYNVLIIVVVLFICKCFFNCLRKVFLNIGYKWLVLVSKNV